MSTPGAAPGEAQERRFGVVVPVKPPGRAKSRLASLGERARRELTVAFAADTVAAALECPDVAEALVITDDLALAVRVRAAGADALPDGRPGDLNASLWQGAAELHRREPGLRLVGLCGDLPCLRPAELSLALRGAADERGPAFVADAAGAGTTLYTAPDLACFSPAFGPSSRAAHLQSGAVELACDLADGLEADPAGLSSVRRDVDTPADLLAAEALGLGPATAAVLAALRA